MMDDSSCSEYLPETHEILSSWCHNLQEVNCQLPLIPTNSCYFPTWSQEFSASRSHSEAEKRRRDRINAQLSTLRKLIPTSEKMDKAGLLRSVVEHVKDLKERAKEMSTVLNTPSDIDEVIIEEEDESSNNNNILVKVSFSCDDRPELFSELNRGLKNLKLTTIEANITSLGGRIKCIFSLQSINVVWTTHSLKHSLRVLLARIATSPSTPNFRIKSKRQRFFLLAT
ncbi:hypothetical protein KY284_026713 [Solanum tuberosum]|nr:hypothetical protein KY284_026713 [Solanum tuberosum]